MDFLFQLLVDAINLGVCVRVCVSVMHMRVRVGRTAPHGLAAELVALDQLKEGVRVRRMRSAPWVLPELEADTRPRPPWS